MHSLFSTSNLNTSSCTQEKWARSETNFNRELKQLQRRHQRVCGLTILFVENKIDNFARASQFWLPLFAVTLHQFSNVAFYGERDGIRPYTLRGHQC